MSKKDFSKRLQKDNLAIGCYFKNKNLIDNYFNEKRNFDKRKEYYLLSVINYLIEKNINVFDYKLNNFVHLGTPDQYEDFIKWRNEIKKIMLILAY